MIHISEIIEDYRRQFCHKGPDGSCEFWRRTMFPQDIEDFIREAVKKSSNATLRCAKCGSFFTQQGEAWVSRCVHASLGIIIIR